MVQLYKEYLIGKHLVSQLEKHKSLISAIPWEHNILLMQIIKERSIRFWYIEQVVLND